ncbi:MAG: hypothetical protein GX247_02595 [Mollicutes bacterium]|nr:hypothetical protein [Mollicutes bacterium]
MKKNNKKRKNKKEKKKVNILLILLIIVLLLSGTFFYFFMEKYITLAARKIIRDNLVTEGNGLYKDIIKTGFDKNEPFSSKYYFKGNKLNNYLIFEGNCWHIINIAQNNTIKIMYIGKSVNNKCNNTINELEDLKDLIVWNDISNNNWHNSTILALLKTWEKNNSINDQIKINFSGENSKIVEATWYIGGVRFINQSLSADILQERTNNLENSSELPVYQGKLGLITVSDYLKVSCEKGSYASTPDCKNNNFLVRDYPYWTMTATDSGKQTAWALKDDGSLAAVNTAENGYTIYPVVYLRSDIKITGTGSIDNPYIVID